MQRAATAYNEIRAIRESVLADKNLSSTGQQAEIGKRLEKAAPTLRKPGKRSTARAPISTEGARGCALSSKGPIRQS
jgi:hypothetical protein